MNTMTVKDYRNRCPNFFSRANRRFFGDRGHRVWKGFLLTMTTFRPSAGPLERSVSIYRPLGEDDVLWVGTADSIEDARDKINAGELK